MIRIKQKMFSQDESIKYVMETEDGHFFECIYMPHGDEGIVLCLSCQIGCVNKCNHCATGKVDYVRDLDYTEICEEVKVMLSDNEYVQGTLVTILFMGMGEPFLNFNNVIKAIDIMNSDLGIRDEDITISTVGIPKRIEQFSQLNRKIQLAVSLHATSSDVRSRIIPLNKIYDLDEVLDAIAVYDSKKLRPVRLQYTMIGNVNDDVKDAENLVSIAKRYNCEVRLIPFNPSPQIAFEETTDEQMHLFGKVLSDNNIEYVVNRSRGIDVSGGCGQLYLYGV